MEMSEAVEASGQSFNPTPGRLISVRDVVSLSASKLWAGTNKTIAPELSVENVLVATNAHGNFKQEI